MWNRRLVRVLTGPALILAGISAWAGDPYRINRTVADRPETWSRLRIVAADYVRDIRTSRCNGIFRFFYPLPPARSGVFLWTGSGIGHFRFVIGRIPPRSRYVPIGELADTGGIT